MTLIAILISSPTTFDEALTTAMRNLQLRKSPAFAHVATARLNITSVFKLAHFVRSGSHGDSCDLSKQLSLDHSAGRAAFRNIAIQSIAMPANDSNSNMYTLRDSIRRNIDFCETFSCKHNVDIETSRSRSIAIGDIATLANMSLSMPD